MNEKPSPNRMLRVHEVASILRVHPKTVRRWSDQGLLKTYRVGPRRDRTFKLEDVDKFLRRGRTEGDSDKGTVLIVDDNQSTRRMLKHVIEGQGYRAIAVENADSAKEELKKQQFDLIFLDLVLPGRSGIDVLRSMKGKERRVPVAVVIAYGDDGVAAEAISVRPVVFIRKPFDVTDIIGVLDALGSKR